MGRQLLSRRHRKDYKYTHTIKINVLPKYCVCSHMLSSCQRVTLFAHAAFGAPGQMCGPSRQAHNFWTVRLWLPSALFTFDENTSGHPGTLFPGLPAQFCSGRKSSREQKRDCRSFPPASRANWAHRESSTHSAEQ